MVDAWSIVGTVGGALGAIGGAATTIFTIRAASNRRSVERARDAVILLESLDALPVDETAGTRLLLNHSSETDVRRELRRIVRENAASYALHNPTPTGYEVARLLTVVYGALALLSTVLFFAQAPQAEGQSVRLAFILTGSIFATITLALLFAGSVLWDRMLRRNRARKLAGTPGQEHYFSAVSEVTIVVKRVARDRRMRRSS